MLNLSPPTCTRSCFLSDPQVCKVIMNIRIINGIALDALNYRPSWIKVNLTNCQRPSWSCWVSSGQSWCQRNSVFVCWRWRTIAVVKSTCVDLTIELRKQIDLKIERMCWWCIWCVEVYDETCWDLIKVFPLGFTAPHCCCCQAIWFESRRSRKTWWLLSNVNTKTSIEVFRVAGFRVCSVKSISVIS